MLFSNFQANKPADVVSWNIFSAKLTFCLSNLEGQHALAVNLGARFRTLNLSDLNKLRMS